MPDINEPTEAEIEAATHFILGGSTFDHEDRVDMATNILSNFLAARRVSSAPSFADGIEAPSQPRPNWNGWRSIDTAPEDCRVIRFAYIDNIYMGAIDNLIHHQRQLDADGIEVGVSRQALCEVLDAVNSALAHNPQASNEGSTVHHGEKSVDAKMAILRESITSSEPPHDGHTDPPRSGAAEGNEAEATAPKPDPAIAELVERLRERTKIAYIGSCKCGECQLVPITLIHQAIAALTASNDRVAELERERDEAREGLHFWEDRENKALHRVEAAEASLAKAIQERDEALATMTRATEAMVECGNLLADEELKREAAEAEVSRLKADIGRKEAALLAFASEENWRQGGAFDPNSPSFCGIGIASAALSNQAKASK